MDPNPQPTTRRKRSAPLKAGQVTADMLQELFGPESIPTLRSLCYAELVRQANFYFQRGGLPFGLIALTEKQEKVLPLELHQPTTSDVRWCIGSMCCKDAGKCFCWPSIAFKEPPHRPAHFTAYRCVRAVPRRAYNSPLLKFERQCRRCAKRDYKSRLADLKDINER